MKSLLKLFSLDNERGQISFGNLNSLGKTKSLTSSLGNLGGLLNTGSNIWNSISGLFGGGSSGGNSTLGIPNSLLGAGALLGSTFADQEPGSVTEARQFLRNRFTSPTALSQQFSGQIGGLMDQYQPLLAQQRQRGIEDISQRFAAAFPATVGAQGPEFGALSRYITDEALPREQAVMADIGRQLLSEQGAAATQLLGEGSQNALAQALGTLGGALLTGGGGGLGGLNLGNLLGTGTTGTGGTSPLGNLGQLFSGQIGQLSPVELATQLALSGDVGNLVSLLSSGALAGTPFPVGISASSPIGQVVQQAINAGLVESPAAQLLSSGATAAGLDFGLPGAGLLGPSGFSSAGGIASGLGAAGAGAGVGYAIGSQFKGGADTSGTRAKAGLGGAAGGAAAGFAVGGSVGAVIGAIAGGISGIFGSSKAEKERKEASIQQETAQTGQARPQAIQMAQAAYQEGLANEQALRPLKPQVVPALSQLIASNDSTVMSIIQQMKAIRENPRYKDIVQATFPSGFSDPYKAAQELAEWSIVNLSGGQGYQENPNPLSNYGMLQSPESGWFFPTFEKLQLTTELMSSLKPLVSQLFSKAGA